MRPASDDPAPVLDPAVAAVLASSVTGLRGAGLVRRGERATVLLLLAAAEDGFPLAATSDALAAGLGLRAVDLLVVHGGSLRAVLRDWVFLAAHGSGRGVALRVEDDGHTLVVRVSAPDSSAREVALRLAAPDDPARAALAALYARAAVHVVDDATA